MYIGSDICKFEEEDIGEQFIVWYIACQLATLVFLEQKLRLGHFHILRKSRKHKLKTHLFEQAYKSV